MKTTPKPHTPFVALFCLAASLLTGQSSLGSGFQEIKIGGQPTGERGSYVVRDGVITEVPFVLPDGEGHAGLLTGISQDQNGNLVYEIRGFGKVVQLSTFSPMETWTHPNPPVNTETNGSFLGTHNFKGCGCPSYVDIWSEQVRKIYLEEVDAQAWRALGRGYVAFYEIVTLWQYNDGKSTGVTYIENGEAQVPDRFRCDGLVEWAYEAALAVATGAADGEVDAAWGVYKRTGEGIFQPNDGAPCRPSDLYDPPTNTLDAQTSETTPDFPDMSGIVLEPVVNSATKTYSVTWDEPFDLSGIFHYSYGWVPTSITIDSVKPEGSGWGWMSSTTSKSINDSMPTESGTYRFVVMAMDKMGHWSMPSGAYESSSISWNPDAPGFIINVSDGNNGDIESEGLVGVAPGATRIFTATPDSGYQVDKWYWDGSSQQTGGTSFTTPAIYANHTLHVTFKETAPSDIDVTSPAGWFTYYQRSKVQVAWVYNPAMGTWVQIDLYRNGSFVETIDASELASGRDYQWTVPNDQPPGEGYQIRVTATATGAYGMSGRFNVAEEPDDDTVIEIRNLSDLQSIGRYGYYKLMNNIDADGYDFQPLGGFSGTLDGNGYSILDLEITKLTEENVGLFRFTYDTAVIKNLTISGGWIRGLNVVGAFCGDFSGLMVNCHSTADIWGSSDDTSHTIGGLVGENFGGTIRNSSCGSEDVRAYSDPVGGIAGENSGTIEYCWSTSPNVEGRDDAGATIRDIGGIVGNNYGTIRECYSRNNEVDSDDYYAGGIAGANNGTIHDCYSLSATDGNYIGSLVGNTEAGAVSNSFGAGNVSDSEGGGLVGDHEGGLFQYCLWDTQTTGKTEPKRQGGGSFTECYGRTTAEMQQRTTFESLGWDFTDVWDIDEGVSYPTLRAAKPSVSTPTGVSASSDRSDGVEVSWSGVTGAGCYMVCRADDVDGNPQAVSGWVTGTSFLDTSAVEDVTHYFWVKAALTAHGAGESDLSAPTAGMRVLGPVPAPASITASDNGLNTVVVDWGSVPSGGFYKLFRAESEAGTKTEITAWITDTSHSDVPPIARRNYYYWVKAAANGSGTRESNFCGPDTGYFRVPDRTHTIFATASPIEGGTAFGAGTFVEGSMAALMADPSANYRFLNWTEGGNVVSTMASYSFTVSSNRVLVANFAVRPDLYLAAGGQVSATDLPARITAMGTVLSVSGLPPGMKFDSKTGKLSGRPTKPGTYTVRVTVRGADGNTRTVDMTILVEPLPVWALGTFTAMIAPPESADSSLTGVGGYVTLTSTASGAYSGSLVLGAKKYSFKGQIEGATEAERGGNPLVSTATIVTNSKDRSRDITLSLEFRPEEHATSPGLAGMLAFQGSSVPIQPGWRHVWNAKTNPAFGNKDRVLHVALANESTEGPQGGGHAKVKLAKAGLAEWKVTLADGKKATGSFTASPDGDVPFYAYLSYPNAGAMIGLLGTEVVGGLLGVVDDALPNGRWIKLPTATKETDRSYRAGFDVNLHMDGAEHKAPAKNVLLFGNPAAGAAMTFGLEEGGLESASQFGGVAQIGLDAQLLAGNKITVEAGELPENVKLKLEFTASSGACSGSISLSDASPLNGKATARTLTYSGLYIPDLDDAAASTIRGFFTLPELPDAAGETSSNTPVNSGRIDLGR